LVAAEQVGLDYAPPYLAPTTHGDQLLQGVNYASGAAGILDESGAAFVSRTPPLSLTTLVFCKHGLYEEALPVWE